MVSSGERLIDRVLVIFGEKTGMRASEARNHHEMLVAVRLVAFGSRKTVNVLAEGGSPEWSTASPVKYSYSARPEMSVVTSDCQCIEEYSIGIAVAAVSGSGRWEHCVKARAHLVDVYGIVLTDHVLKALAEALNRTDVLLVLFRLFEKAHRLLNLEVVDVLWPPALCVQDTLTEQFESFGVCFMLRTLRDALDGHVCRVPFHKVLQLPRPKHGCNCQHVPGNSLNQPGGQPHMSARQPACSPILHGGERLYDYQVGVGNCFCECFGFNVDKLWRTTKVLAQFLVYINNLHLLQRQRPGEGQKERINPLKLSKKNIGDAYSEAVAMFALLAATPQTLSITPSMQKNWPAHYPNMIQSYKDAQAEVSLSGLGESLCNTLFGGGAITISDPMSTQVFSDRLCCWRCSCTASTAAE